MKDEDFVRLLLPLLQAVKRPMVGTDGKHYGVEQSTFKTDSLDVIVDRYLDVALQATPSNSRLKILEVGGGTGHRAEKWAAKGADVLVTALNDCESEILRRNEKLGREALSFLRQDIREANAADLRENWALVHMRRVLHWMPEEDIVNVLNFLPKISGQYTHFAACINHWPDETLNFLERMLGKAVPMEDHFQNYSFQRIDSLMREAGYKIIYSNEEATSLLGIRNCQFFASMPSPR